MQMSNLARDLLKAWANERSQLLQPLYDAVNEVRTGAMAAVKLASMTDTGLDQIGRSAEAARAFGAESAALVVTVALRSVEDRLAARMMAEELRVQEFGQDALVFNRKSGELDQPNRDGYQVVDDGTLYDALLDRCGFEDGAELTSDGLADNDLAHERADAVMAFLGLIRHVGSPLDAMDAVMRYANSLPTSAEVFEKTRQAGS